MEETCLEYFTFHFEIQDLRKDHIELASAIFNPGVACKIAHYVNTELHLYEHALAFTGRQLSIIG